MLRYLAAAMVISLLPAYATAQPSDSTQPTGRLERVQPDERSIGQFMRSFENERFSLAFMRQRPTDNYARIEASLSRDGASWHDAHFPDFRELTLRDTSGVGTCGSVDGQTLMVVYNDRRGAVHVVEGLVSSNTVTWPAVSKRILVNNADSAPACIFLENGVRLVAFRSGEEMNAHIYIEGGSFIGEAGTFTFDMTGMGRPALASHGNTALMAWRTPSSDPRQCSNIIIAKGGMVQAGPISTFSFNRREVLQLSADRWVPCPRSDPVLATDGRNFYLAVIQGSSGRRGGQYYFPVLYRSLGSDLNSRWTKQNLLSLDVIHESYIGLAVSEVGTMLAAKILNTGPNYIEARLFADSEWQDLGSNPWLGLERASFRQFGATRFGVHDIRPSITDVPRLAPGFPE